MKFQNLRNLCLFFSFLGLLGCTDKDSAKQKEVNLAIWGNYFSDEMQKVFSQKTGIKINISNYSSNEELLTKIQSGASGIDVAVPSDYMVQIMAKLDLLLPLEKLKIQNASEISSEWLGLSYDQANKFSLPYAWTVTGIAVNKALFSGKIDSWQELFSSQDLNGKISLLDDVREATGAVLKSKGHSLNTTKPEELKTAEAALIKIKKNLKMFRSDTIEALVNKEVAAAQTYSSDALQAIEKDKNIVFIIPREGSSMAVDNLVIMKNTRHSDEAHKLVNFLISPEFNLNFVNSVKGGPVLKTTKEKLSPELQASKTLFPEPNLFTKLERIQDLGESTKLYDDLWTRIKSE